MGSFCLGEKGFIHKLTFAAIAVTILAFSSASNAGEGVIFPPDPSRARVGVGVSGGPVVSYGYCPCFRWQVTAYAGSGYYETRDILISSDALLKYQEAFGPVQGRMASRYFTGGALEALSKGGRIGIGFSGITIAKDLDRGYVDILKTGLAFIVNLVRNDAVRLDLRSGYEYEQFSVNYNPDPERLSHLPQTVAFSWNAGSWSGNVKSSIDIDPTGRRQVGFQDNALVQARFLSLSGFAAQIGLGGGYDYDPFRLLIGMNPHIARLGLFMTLMYEPIVPAAKKTE